MASPSALPAQPATQASDNDVPLPRVLGRYTLLKLIARGGMGEVFLAAAGGIEGAERPCVVKLIRREHADDPSFLARFLDEARVQAQLSHPGVAQILEASMDETGQPFVVVEFVEGRSLAEVRARAIQMAVRVGWAEAVAMGASVAEALSHVHERVDVRGNPLNIAHRDLSPQNVMVSFSGETKLIDFGTARGANRKSRTVAGVVFAKPGYVAPEVANGIPGDALVDVYALGVMIWELCAGRRFLQGEASEHMAAVAANKRPLPRVAAACGAPDELDAILARMTCHDKSARASAREAFSELIKLLSSAPASPTGERGVRGRIGTMLAALYPAEPKRSRAEFVKLLSQARRTLAEAPSSKKEPVAQPQKPAQVTEEGLLPGTRYRLAGKIGEGAGGEVYEAVHVDLSRRVAIKILTPERASRSRDAARFRREAWALSKVSHPNLVKLYDFGVATDGRLFFAMEYLEGETLERCLEREKALAIEDSLRIARETASALEAAHGVGLVHRDIKPENLFLTRDGGVKVLDFGVVCAPGDGTGEAEGATPSLAMFGTPEYMAPEQIDGGSIDGRADVYALGSVLYEMLTGRLPYNETSAVQTLEAKKKQDPEKPSERAPARKVPPMLDALVMKALERRPADRFTDVVAMREAIEQAERAQKAPPPRRRALAFAAVAAVMAGALALLGASGNRLPAQGVAMQSSLARIIPALAPKRAATPVAQAEPQQIAAEIKAEQPTPSADKPEKEPVAEAPARAEPPREEPAAKAEAPEQKPVARASEAEISAARGKAQKAAAKKRWKLAKKHAEEWVKLDSSTEGRVLLARALFNTGKGTDARDVLITVLEAHPDSEEARTLMTEIEAKGKRPKAAGHKVASRGRLATARQGLRGRPVFG